MKDLLEHIYGAIDWTSIKLCGISTPFFLMKLPLILNLLGALVMCSTLVYNAVRIYKELKNKP